VTTAPPSVGDAPAPPAYLEAIAARLLADEPGAWTAMAGAVAPDDDGLRTGLLRSSYRLDPDGHPRVHAAAGRAAKALGVRRPVAAHQVEGGGEANAALVTLGGELVVLFSGPLLELLTDDELTAVFGHELAHHVLDVTGDGGLGVAARLLTALAADPESPPAFAETRRRWALATELYADRGALVACGDLHVAVSALVKIVTGLREVDPAAYLRQGEQAAPATGSQVATHPETPLRAWALGQWHAGAAAGEAAAAALLAPSLDLDALDLADRAALEDVTRALLEDVLADSWWRTDAVVAHARLFFPDLDPTPVQPAAAPAWGTPTAGEARVVPDAATAATRRYLAYVLLDLVTADPDLDGEDAVGRALAVAHRVGLGAAFEEVARAELSLPAAVWRRVVAAVPRPVGEPEVPA
jgi:hypothetical protein